MFRTVGVLIALFTVCQGQRFSRRRDPYLDMAGGPQGGRFDSGRFADPTYSSGADLMPSDRFSTSSFSSSFSSPDFLPSGSSRGGFPGSDPGFSDPYGPPAYSETGGRFSSSMDPGFPGIGGHSDFGSTSFPGGSFEGGSSFGSPGQPPPGEYIGARGGQNGYPVQGGYCAGDRCADGGLAAGVGLGIGSGTAGAMEHRRRTGRNEDIRMYEMFAGGPGAPGGGPRGPSSGGMGFGGGMPGGPPGPPGPPGFGGMPGMGGMPPLMPPRGRGGFLGGPPPMGPPMGRPMYRFR